MNKQAKIKLGIIFLVLVGIFSLCFVFAGMPEEENPVITYTQSTDKTCQGGKCNLIFYSGIRNVYEDETWKRIENARSLKDKGFDVIYLENDPAFNIIVNDFNISYMDVDLEFLGNPEDYLECQVKDELNAKCDFKLDEKWNEYDETTGEVIEKSQLKFQYKWEMKDGIIIKGDKIKYEYKGNPFNNSFTFGGHSTTIILQDPDTENLDDSYVYKTSGNTNYGTADNLRVGSEGTEAGTTSQRAYIKFSLSGLPDGSTINEAFLSIYEWAWGTDGMVEVFNVTNDTWDESTITWNYKPDNGSSVSDSLDVTTDDTWYNFNITPNWISYNLDDNLISFMIRETTIDDNYNKFYSKEYTTDTSKRPFLNITYIPGPDITPPTYSNAQTNTTVAGASCLFSILYNDINALHPNGTYIFSTNNTGPWANESAVNWTSTPQWANVTKTLNSTVGLTIGYRWYADDSAEYSNNTGIYILTITSALQTYTRNITQSTTTTSAIDRTGSLKRDTPQYFTMTSLVDRLTNFFRSISDTITINTTTIAETLKRFTRYITESFNITELVDRLAGFFRDIPQSISINAITDKISNFFKNIPQSFTINNIVDRIASFFRTITQVLSINDITERIGDFFRTIIQSFTINNIVEKVSTAAQRISTDFFRVIVNYTPSFVDRVVSFFRNPIEFFNINALLDRLANFFRDLLQSFNLNNIVERLRTVLRWIAQFFQMLFSLFISATYLALNWITSVETLTQLQAYEEPVRVPWGLFDNWTSDVTSPQNWINATKTYNLTYPAGDCANVQVEIEGENRTYSILVSNVGCNYTIINNNTITPGSSSNITINYTTTAITSAEGYVNWLATNRRVSVQTHWENTLYMKNPSPIHDYVDISVNITTDKYALPATINITNSTPTIFTHTFNNTDGNVNWSLLELDSLDDYLFTTRYRTDNITLSYTNHTETILGKIYEVWNITIEADSIRPILKVLSYFNFTDTNIVSNKLYKCADGIVNCTDDDISNRGDVVWYDLDADGSYDYIEWRVLNLTQNQSYQLHNDRGLPIQITISKQILNKPVYVFDNVLWRTTLTMYNPNNFSTEKVYKYEFPLGSADIELDDIGKNLQYDPFGTLAPYITILDKDDPAHPNSVYLSFGQTKIFTIEYRTESVTLDSSTYFPSYFKVDENALINQVLRIKNQAEDNITDVEYRIPIDYAEDLIVCENEYEKGCPDDEETDEYKNVTIDTKDSVKGDYTLEIDELASGETMYITLSYKTPTAIIKSIERGRRVVQRNMTTFKKIVIESQARFTMGDLRYQEPEIACEEVIDILKCRVTALGEICDIPIGYGCGPLTLKLGTVGMSESVTAYIWYIELPEERLEPTFIDNIIGWFMENIWNGGTKIEVKGFWKYVGGFLASKDITTGELYIPMYRLILVCSIVGLILGFIGWRFIRRRRKKRKQ